MSTTNILARSAGRRHVLSGSTRGPRPVNPPPVAGVTAPAPANATATAATAATATTKRAPLAALGHGLPPSHPSHPSRNSLAPPAAQQQQVPSYTMTDLDYSTHALIAAGARYVTPDPLAPARALEARLRASPDRSWMAEPVPTYRHYIARQILPPTVTEKHYLHGRRDPSEGTLRREQAVADVEGEIDQACWGQDCQWRWMDAKLDERFKAPEVYPVGSIQRQYQEMHKWMAEREAERQAKLAARSGVRKAIDNLAKSVRR